MYNFSSKREIPLHNSIAVTVCLQPWFETEVLEKGLAILRETELSHFFFHRHIACAIFQNEYPLTIVYEKTTRITQGFTLKTQHCSLCDRSRHKKRCEHIAALCLLSLIEKHDEKPFPIPLLFRNSKWGKLAGFLHDWLKHEQGPLESSFDENSALFVRKSSEGGSMVKQLNHRQLAELFR